MRSPCNFALPLQKHEPKTRKTKRKAKRQKGFSSSHNQCPAGTRTRPATWYFFRYLTRFSFGNHRVAGNPEHRVLPDISGKPKVSGYYPILWLSPVRGKQYHHQVLFFGNHKKDPRVQKKCKITILTSSMTVEHLLVGQSFFKTYDP